MSLPTKVHTSLLLAVLALMPSCVPSQAPAPAAPLEATQELTHWAGRYRGIIACTQCTGRLQELTINEAGFYTFKELHANSQKPTRTQGRFSWSADGTQLILAAPDNRVYQRTPKGLCLADTQDACLQRQDEFNGGGAQLFVAPESVRKSTSGGQQIVEFDALMNFEHRMEGGHKSLTATMRINCDAKTVDMPRVAYYSKDDAEGKKLYSTDENAGSWVPLPQDSDDVMTQAKEHYCPKS